mgnify:CR=1 FL=1
MTTFDDLKKKLKAQNIKRAKAEKKINKLKKNDGTRNDKEIQAERNRIRSFERNIEDLKQQIADERSRVAEAMEANLDDLDWLNNVLDQCDLDPESTPAKARATIKKNIIINIYDLEKENFGARFKSFSDFLQDIHARKRYFPLQQAKENGHLKLFLKVVFGRS